MIKLMKYLVAPLVLFAGCVAYEPATLVDGLISNPKVGWNGYSVQVPGGLHTIKTSSGEGVSDRESAIREWYDQQSNRYAADYYTSFSEQFIFEPSDESYFLSFITDTYELRTGWSVLTSVELQYLVQKLINRKMVIINDMDAHFEQVEINGQRGWYISGTSKPYFKKKPKTLAYEGVCLLGGLKELYWFEAFGSAEAREDMKLKVYEMAESLKVQ
ncbi:hypothetical protein P4B35_05290 [Pontiellaceae bacterium B12227]|nr:hypothetical protein [Pontiellaceae bacterium B12227]